MDATDDALLSLLNEATVRIDVSGVVSGTGFVVAPGHVVTCYHVVESALVPAQQWGEVSVRGADGSVRHPTSASSYDADADLAWLHLDGPTSTPVVQVDESLQVDDDLYSWGYSPGKPDGVPSTFTAEGRTGGPSPWIRFKARRVVGGMSGAPLLNRRSGAVCGVINRTVDVRQESGGYAVPVDRLFRSFEALTKVNAEATSADPRWREAMTGRQRAQASAGGPQQTRSVDLVVEVVQEADRWTVCGRAPGDPNLPPTPVDLNGVRAEVARLFRSLRATDRLDEQAKCRLLGQVLARAVLPAQVEQRFDALFAEGDVRVDVNLHFESSATDDLVYLPWELLNLAVRPDRKAIILGSDRRLTLSRVQSGAPAARSERPRVGLTALLVRAPDALGSIRPVQDLAEAARAAVSPVLGDGLSDLGASVPDDVEKHLTAAGDVDVLHYVGFGRYHDQADEIAFNGEPYDRVLFLGAEDFAEHLSQGTPPRLVVLQPSDVPKGEPAKVPADLAAMAPELLLRGVAAVVVMPQPQCYPDQIRTMTALFYTEVARGESVQVAVQAMRAHPSVRRLPWLYPALFLDHPGELRLVRRSGGRSRHA